MPWALTHFVGWPLPDHLPSWAEIQSVLLGPMTATFLLDFLACATWIVWALFTLDVVRCAVVIARDPRVPDRSAVGPVRRVAAVLVGGVLISILGHRLGVTPESPPVAGPGPGSEVVSTALAWPHPLNETAGQILLAGYASPHRSDSAADQTAPAKSAVALVPDPDTGIHDSLWRIAQRTLGDGNRWPEIFELNKGKPQPNGGTLTRPSLIFPGEEFALPAGATAPAPLPTPAPEIPPPTTATPIPTSPPPPPPSTQDEPHTTQPPLSTQEAPPPSTDVLGESVFSWGDELFVGVGLAAAVSAALAVARRRHRRRYRPGSGDRTDLPVAPVVYQLRLAHLCTGHDDLNEPDERPRHATTPQIVLGTPGQGRDEQTPALSVGVQDGRDIALNLAIARGLGLVGAGAPAAVRALLVTALTTPSGTARVVVPTQDLAALLGHRAAQTPLPTDIHVVADLDAALDTLEAETLVRANQNRHAPDDRWPPLVLVARTPERGHQRLQAVLDNGSSVGVTGLLLGQWASGVTAYVRDDGTISTTNPGLGERLRGTRVFRLGDDDMADLLALLHRADPDDDRAAEPVRQAPAQLSEFEVDLLDGLALHEGDEHPNAGGQATAQVGDLGLELLTPGHPKPDTGLEILGAPPAPTSSPGLRLRQTRWTAENGPYGAATEERRSERTGDDASPLAPLRIRVLGPPQMWWRPGPEVSTEPVAEREITSAFQPRVRELLVFLALHPDGASREALIGALWASSPPEKTTNAMNTSLSRLRHSIAAATRSTLTEVVLAGEGRYRLAPDLVEVDYHRFAAAVAARRAAATEQDRIDAYRHIVDYYAGPLADGLSTEWLETAREAIRRDAIDAVAALARALVEHDPQQTLDLLEMARAFDPHNELIYRDIMRLQERLGQLDAIPRTLTLLTTRLTEIDDRPTPQAVSLAERLRHRHETTRDPSPPFGADRRHDRTG